MTDVSINVKGDRAPKKTKTRPTQGRQQPVRRKPVKNVVKVVNTKGEQRLVYSVPHCTQDYLKALYDPFNTPNGVCIPTGDYPLDSFKTKVETKGSLRLSTTGIGFITTKCPRSNNSSTVKFTTGTSVGANNQIFSTFTNQGTNNFVDIPFNDNDFVGGNIYARTVSCGIRLSYRGKLMDQNGVAIIYEHRDHGDVVGFTYDTLAENPSSHKIALTQNMGQSKDEPWQTTLCYSGPAVPGETDFNGSNNLSNSYFMIVALSGLPGDQYEFEICQHLEFIGSKATVASTVSHTDPQGFGQVVQAVKTLSRDKPLVTSDGPSLWKTFRESVVSTLPRLVDTVANAASSILPGPLKGLPQLLMTEQNPYRGAGATNTRLRDVGRGFPNPWTGQGLLNAALQMPHVQNDSFSRGLEPWKHDNIPGTNHRYNSLEDILDDEEAMLMIMEKFLTLRRERSAEGTDSPLRKKTSLDHHLANKL